MAVSFGQKSTAHIFLEYVKASLYVCCMVCGELLVPSYRPDCWRYGSSRKSIQLQFTCSNELKQQQFPLRLTLRDDLNKTENAVMLFIKASR